MGQEQNGSALRDRLARGEEAAFAEVELALRAAKGHAQKACDILGIHKSTMSRALADQRYGLRLRRVRDMAAGRERPLRDLLLELPAGVYELALNVQTKGDAESSLRQVLSGIIG